MLKLANAQAGAGPAHDRNSFACREVRQHGRFRVIPWPVAAMWGRHLAAGALIVLLAAGVAFGQAQSDQATDTPRPTGIILDDEAGDVVSLDGLEPGRYRPMPLPAGGAAAAVTPGASDLVIYNPAEEASRTVDYEPGAPLPTQNHVPGQAGKAPVPRTGEPRISPRLFSGLSIVQQPWAYPWSVNVKLFMSFDDGYYVCSGVLIDALHVMTAGHCVYSHEAGSGGWANSIIVVPAYVDGGAPYGVASATHFYSWVGWTRDASFDWDMAYLRLERPVGALTGWHGYGYNDDNNFFATTTFSNPGYPAESPYDGEYMYSWEGTYDDVRTHVLYHQNRSYGGQSGSGAHRVDGSTGGRYVYGVLSHGNDVWTGHTRVNADRFNAIVSQISANTPTTPDLAALAVRAEPYEIQAGQELSSFQYIIYNTASVAWSGTVGVQVYLSENDNISTSDRLIQTRSFTGTIDARSWVNLNASPPRPTVPADVEGIYYVGIILDIADANVDNNDTDGWDAAPLNILPLGEPDISVSPLSLTFTEGQANRVAAVPGTEMRRGLPQHAGTGARSPGVRSGASASDGLPPHVPGRLLVRFREQVTVDPGAAVTGSPSVDALNSRYGVRAMQPLLQPALRSSGAARLSGLSEVYVLEVDAGIDLAEVIAAYAASPDVAYAEPDYLYHADDAPPPAALRGLRSREAGPAGAVPNDPLYASQWGLKNTGQAVSYSGSLVGTPGIDINAEPAWDVTTGSSDVVVAVLDDGVDLAHPEFTGRLVAGYDFIDDDDDPNAVGDGAHGTSCAGIIAAAASNGIGVSGVAPGVRIQPVRVLGADGGTTQSVTNGIVWAVANGADIISMSLGGAGHAQTMEIAVDDAVAAGLVVLAAAGNGNTSEPHYPAAYDRAISVGAMSPCGERKRSSSNPAEVNDGVLPDPNGVTCDGEFWWGSNYGSGLDVLTPGVRIHTTDITGSAGYASGDYSASFNGTSSATPFAAGVAALMRSANPSLTPLQVRAIMQGAAVDLGAPGYDDDSGYGRVDAYGAVVMATSTMSTAAITISNTGLGLLNISSVDADVDWMSVGPALLRVGANGSQTLAVTVYWARVGTTPQTGTLTIRSNDPDEASVVVSVTAVPEPPATYTLAVDAQGLEHGAAIQVSPSDTNGDGDGTTPFARLYDDGTVVTLTAPAAVGDQALDGWSCTGGLTSDQAAVQVTMDADRTCTVTYAAPPATVAVSLPQATGAVGDPAALEVLAGDLTGLDVVSFAFAVSFDPAVVDVTGASVAGTLTDGWSLAAGESTPGVFTVAGSGTALTGAGVLVELQVDYVGAGTSALAWDSFTFNEGSPLASLTDGEVTVTDETCIAVNADAGWNLLSVPVTTGDMSLSVLFPDAVPPAFAYVSGQGYSAEDPLATATGYWLKFDAAQAYTLCGTPVAPKQVPVAEGWNIVGPLEADVSVDDIRAHPDGLLKTGTFFGYEGSYAVAGVLVPGKAYWVQATGAGYLDLDASSAKAGAVADRATDTRGVEATWPVLVVQDASGQAQQLYLAVGEPAMDVAAFALPPPPPAGVFDVRFASGHYVASLADGPAELHLASSHYPVRITALNLGAQRLGARDLFGGRLVDQTLQDGDVLLLAEGIDRIALNVDAEQPRAFSLEQNYPNPFNPVTTIRFGVPEAVHVEVTVYDMLGKRVAQLLDGPVEAGYHEVTFDAQALSSSIYVYTIQAGTFRDVRKMVLMK